eukprot:CAMPEP_0194441628 /NCGR_PEP_ID=MMETSP0176-20130528/122495_1 /TAXON_ID=216777 /ORGANISM="Proboscia alata, Strain PI-D3" /LENGTH=384 /DNA_ID=CAMNT_0039267143 /DNA_START=164 /DNA_END=1318 /DNA_ORIENTATION=+
MNFFSDTFGFKERGYRETRDKLLEIVTLQEAPLKHAPYFREQCDFKFSNGKEVTAGIFSMPSLAELRAHAQNLTDENEKNDDHDFEISVQNIQGDARSLHSSNVVKTEGSAPVVFQAASQFNYLEFPGPNCVPENGISNYINDHTQGPACAVACAAGTAYRNYLVHVPFPKSHGLEPKQRGQTRQNQLNGLADVEEYLLRETELDECPWIVKNGYVESSKTKLDSLNQLLSISDSNLRGEMMSRIRIGIQENTDVTDDPLLNTRVTQTYNSALSIGYSSLSERVWESTAKIVLDASYEATLLTGLIQTTKGKPTPIVFLTLVGGGCFGNRSLWIRQAMKRAIRQVQKYKVSLNIVIVHYSRIDERYIALENLDSGTFPVQESIL